MNTTVPIFDAVMWPLRLAREIDISSLEELIPLSARTLQAPYYSPAQIDAWNRIWAFFERNLHPER